MVIMMMIIIIMIIIMIKKSTNKLENKSNKFLHSNNQYPARTLMMVI